MIHLLAADRVRFGRRRDLWILVGAIPVILALMFLSDFNAVTTPPRPEIVMDPPDPVAEAQIRDEMLAEFRQNLAVRLPEFAFPASLVKVAGNIGPMILLGIYLATALVAGEFEWGTVRTVHLTSSRRATLAVRFGVVVGLVALATAVGLIFAAVIPFLLSVEGRPLQDVAGPVPDLAAQVGIRIVAVLPFIAIPAFLAVLARSTGLAFLLTVLFFAADIALTGAPLWPSSPVPWVPAVTVSGSISRLLGGDESPLAALAPAWASVTALVAWAVVPALAAIARFGRIDLNE